MKASLRLAKTEGSDGTVRMMAAMAMMAFIDSLSFGKTTAPPFPPAKQAAYPLIAPAVRPEMSCLAARKVKMIAGSATSVPMAVMLPHSIPVSVK